MSFNRTQVHSKRSQRLSWLLGNVASFYFSHPDNAARMPRYGVLYPSGEVEYIYQRGACCRLMANGSATTTEHR